MNRFRWLTLFLAGSFITLTLGCASVPEQTVTLSNTVGRDLEEMHKAHRALAKRHFRRIENDINTFIDETYRPAFIRKFAKEFQLAKKIQKVQKRAPEKMLPLLTRFVEEANQRIEKQRKELLQPVLAKKSKVIIDIDESYRQIQAAHAIITGHLASVRDVREVQNKMMAEAGLGGVRKRIVDTTSNVSSRLEKMIKKGKEIDSKADSAVEKVNKISQEFTKFQSEI